MVELVDTLASGASGGNPVEVRVLFSVPLLDCLTVHNGANVHKGPSITELTIANLTRDDWRH